MTAPQDTERLVGEIDELHDRAYNLSRVVLDRDSNRDDFCDYLRDNWPALRAALLSPAGREGEIERLIAQRSDAIGRANAHWTGICHLRALIEEALAAAPTNDAERFMLMPHALAELGWFARAKAAVLASLTPAPDRTDVAAAKSHTIEMPKPTPDQQEYLQKILDHQAEGYDPTEMVGGPRKSSAPSPTTPPDFIDTIAMETACRILVRPPDPANGVTDAKALIASEIHKVIAEHDRRAGTVREGWRAIESAPKDNTQILATTEDGRIMIWAGEMLSRVMSGKQPFHLQFPATHWMPLPASPLPGEQGGQSASLTGGDRQ